MHSTGREGSVRRTARAAQVLAALLAVALVASACGGGGGGGESPENVTVEWGEPENPLVPGNTTEQNGGDALDAMFTGLVAYDPNTAAPSNAQAESIDTTDNRTFTIRIKPGWTFHDGSPVTAQSYVDSWNWTAFGPNAAQAQSFMEKIEGYAQVSEPNATVRSMSGLRVVDPTTFTATLTEPFTIFPTTLGYSAYYPLPRKFFDDQAGFEAAPIGNGPFRFVSRSPNQNLVMARYDQYTGTDRAQVAGLEFRVYDNLQTAYDDVVSGNLDEVRKIPDAPLAGDRWRADLGPGAKQKDGLLTQTLTVPSYDPRFRNVDVRRALSMAIDRQAIAQQIFNGSRVPLDGYATRSTEGYVPGQCGEFCTFNPQRAKELLAGAGGWQGPLTLTANTDGGHDAWMQAVAGQLRQNLGIDAQYTPLPSFSEQRRLANAGQLTGLARAGWQADYPSLESFLTQLYRTGASSNDSKYSNPAVDAALDAADQAPDVPAADRGYAEAERLILADLPAIPIFSVPVQYGNSSRLTAGERNPLDRLDSATLQLAPQG